MRTLLVTCSALFAGATAALAQDSVDGVLLADPHEELRPQAQFTLSGGPEAAARFSAPEIQIGESPAPQRLELELAASGPLDVSVAQRAAIGVDAAGDMNRQSRGSEVRIGRNLVQEEGQENNSGSSIYMFVASDDEALIWRPGQRDEMGGQGGGFALQDRVEIGDMSAGVTYQRGPVQASIAYVEREVSAQVGRESFSKDERFGGITLTVRR